MSLAIASATSQWHCPHPQRAPCCSGFIPPLPGGRCGQTSDHRRSRAWWPHRFYRTYSWDHPLPGGPPLALSLYPLLCLSTPSVQYFIDSINATSSLKPYSVHHFIYSSSLLVLKYRLYCYCPGMVMPTDQETIVTINGLLLTDPKRRRHST